MFGARTCLIAHLQMGSLDVFYVLRDVAVQVNHLQSSLLETTILKHLGIGSITLEQKRATS